MPNNQDEALGSAQELLERVLQGFQARKAVARRKRGRAPAQVTVDTTALGTATTFLDRIGKALPRLIDPFRSLDVIICEGSLSEEAFEQQQGGPLCEEAKDEHRRYVAAYNILIERCPEFREVIRVFRANAHSSEFERLIQEISDMGETCRSNDTSTLKRHPRLLLQENEPTPPSLESPDKTNRGFNHPLCGRLLCPAKHAGNPDAIQQIKTAAIKVKASAWPIFLYEDEVYDPRDIEAGLLRGWLLIRVARHLLTGPSTALTPCRTIPKGSNADKLGINTFTPQLIAYIAVQARMMLSSAPCWSVDDGNFSNFAFHNRIISLFDDDGSGAGQQWSRETISWWNSQVFPCIQTTNDASDESDDEDARLKRQRLERL